MISLEKEADLLERIDDGLREAVKAENLNWSRATRIKRQKYTNLALDHFLEETPESESPVTRSWFKYGETQPLSPAGPTRLEFEQPETPKGPISQGELDSDSGTTTESQDTEDEPTIKDHQIFDLNSADFMQFFLEPERTPPLTSEYWNASDLDFLITYYEEHAPADLRDVYLANVELRKVLVNAQKDLEDIYENRHLLYKDSEPTSLPDLESKAYYQQAGQKAVELRLAMRRHETLFDDSIEPVHDCTNLIEDTLMMLQQLPREDITPPHRQFLQELEEFYDSIAWMLAAYEMSEHTAEGPRAGKLEAKAAENFEKLLDEYPNLLKEIQKESARKGLNPAPNDFESPDDGASTIVDEVMKAVDRPRYTSKEETDE